MNALKATVRSGRLEVDAPPDWPDGTQVLIEPTPPALKAIGIDESQWNDSPDSLADWDAWIKTIEPFEFTPDEADNIAQFDREMRQYNLEAVERQMRERTCG